ncbi:MAG TPA: hypothetical protein VGK58_14870 [Lacipirellulaceae bacterium]
MALSIRHFAKHRYPPVRGLLVSCMLLCIARTTAAEGFRIETVVYAGDDEEPASEATTLFLDGVVYDFLTGPEQTAVFRKPASGKPGRFILLNPRERIRTEFTTEQLTGAMQKLRTWAARQDDPFLQFAADPEFKESFEPESGELILASHLESYTVETERVEHAQALAEYREFLDWYARLNTLLSGGPPPEPRLRLNAALARHEVVPLKVELKRGRENESLRAEHKFTWRLSNADVERIDDVRASLAAYKSVPNEEFMRGSEER